MENTNKEKSKGLLYVILSAVAILITTFTVGCSLVFQDELHTLQIESIMNDKKDALTDEINSLTNEKAVLDFAVMQLEEDVSILWEEKDGLEQTILNQKTELEMVEFYALLEIIGPSQDALMITLEIPKELYDNIQINDEISSFLNLSPVSGNWEVYCVGKFIKE